jgi:hypothetical protein
MRLLTPRQGVGHTSLALSVCLKAFLRPAVRDPSWILPADETPMVPPRLRIVYSNAVALGYNERQYLTQEFHGISSRF